MANTTLSGRRVLLAGASGLVGTALAAELKTQGCTVTRLVRREVRAGDEAGWNPACGEIDSRAVAEADAVVNLCGENVGAGRWTRARMSVLRSSRIDATHTLVEAMRAGALRPAVLVNASATGYYGDTGENVADERAERGNGFLAELCSDWEAEARKAEALGVRVVCARLGVVLTAQGGALTKMLPAFRLGLGGRLGSGQQWMSWIGLDDAVGALVHVMANAACVGPINLVAPEAVTNTEFTAALARVLRRPAVLPAPAWALRLALGRMADEALLASTRAEPRVLRETGYRFRQATLEAALRRTLEREFVTG